jgi:integrase
VKQKKAFPNVSGFFDQYKTPRWRYRKKGMKPVYLPGPYGSPEFIQAYEEARGNLIKPGEKLTIPGSIGSLVAGNMESADFKLLADNTKRTYRYHLERFRKANGAKPIRDITREAIVRKMDTMTDKPPTANIWLKVMKAMCSYAVARNIMRANPCKEVKRLKDKTDGIHSWTDAQIEQFEARWPVGTKENLALRLHLYTAQRRSDVVVMGKQHERNGSIVLRQRKTRMKLVLPIVPKLREAIDKSPTGDLTYLVTEFGKPFSNAGFGNWFREKCDAAGLKNCSAHGLRKAAARRMAEAGKSVHEIMAITGHRALSEVERYTRAANQEALAVRASDGLSGAKKEPGVG